MDERLKIALELVREGAAIIKANFGKTHTVELKGDSSPVTVIDKQINSRIARKLKENFPEDGLLGEEESYGDGTEQYQWICDPLDGTKPFLLGLPFSVCMLGLSKGGQMLLSAVCDPYSGKLYHAVRGTGAFCDNFPIRVSQQTASEGYALVGADSFMFGAKLKQFTGGVEPVPGTGYKCLMIATGRGLGMINDAADFHDIGPGSLIVEEAGGKVTGLDGEALRYDNELTGVIVSNGIAHEEFVRIASAIRPH